MCLGLELRFCDAWEQHCIAIRWSISDHLPGSPALTALIMFLVRAFLVLARSAHSGCCTMFEGMTPRHARHAEVDVTSSGAVLRVDLVNLVAAAGANVVSGPIRTCLLSTTLASDMLAMKTGRPERGELSEPLPYMSGTSCKDSVCMHAYQYVTCNRYTHIHTVYISIYIYVYIYICIYMYIYMYICI